MNVLQCCCSLWKTLSPSYPQLCGSGCNHRKNSDKIGYSFFLHVNWCYDGQFRWRRIERVIAPSRVFIEVIIPRLRVHRGHRPQAERAQRSSASGREFIDVLIKAVARRKHISPWTFSVVNKIKKKRVDVKQGSATYGPRAGSGPPSKIILSSDPLQIVVTAWPA